MHHRLLKETIIRIPNNSNKLIRLKFNQKISKLTVDSNLNLRKGCLQIV